MSNNQSPKLTLTYSLLSPNAKAPIYASASAAGFDLYTASSGEIKPHNKQLIETHLALAIPEGYVGIIKDRSGLAHKDQGTRAGVIDSDYRGEVKVILRNESNTIFTYEKHTRIAQMLIIPCPQVALQEVQKEALGKTDRGEGGFGSTGTREVLPQKRAADGQTEDQPESKKQQK